MTAMMNADSLYTHSDSIISADHVCRLHLLQRHSFGSPGHFNMQQGLGYLFGMQQMSGERILWPPVLNPAYLLLAACSGQMF